MRLVNWRFPRDLILPLAACVTPLAAASFQGRVFELREGRHVAVAGVRVEIRQNSDALATAFSDADGRYSVENLPDTRLTITASKPGWKTVRAGPRARSFLVFDCSPAVENRQGICAAVDFELSRGGIITGQVLDPFGEPAMGTRIFLRRSDAPNASSIEMGRGEADDRGLYRVGPVAAGQYQIVAHLLFPWDTHSLEYTSVETTVEVEAGGETVAPLVLGLARKYRISGRVEGISPPTAVFPYTQQQGVMSINRSLPPSWTGKDGTFTMSGVPEGTVAFWTAAAGGDNTTIFLGEFDVRGDLADVVLRPAATGRISGQVKWQGERLPARMQIPLEGGTGGFHGSLIVEGPEFAFDRDLPPGNYALRTAGPHSFVYQVLEGDEPLPGSRFTLHAHQHRRLTILASDRFAEIRGHVRQKERAQDGAGRPADHYEVVLEGSGPARVAATDQFGFFTLQDLPPAGYVICAFPERPPRERSAQTRANGICAAASQARRISVEPGSEIEIDFTAE